MSRADKKDSRAYVCRALFAPLKIAAGFSSIKNPFNYPRSRGETIDAPRGAAPASEILRARGGSETLERCIYFEKALFNNCSRAHATNLRLKVELYPYTSPIALDLSH